MNDIAHEVTERLYGDDKVKCEFIFHWLTGVKKIFDALGDGYFDEYTKNLSEGRWDVYMMAMVEHLEDKIDLEVLTDKMRKHIANLIPDIDVRTFKKIVEICEDENILSLTDVEKLDKNSAKKMFKRLDEMENS